MSNAPISFQFWRSLLAWMGMPGKALKLDEAQKKVLFQRGTKMQLGSGWKPGNMGLLKVELAPATVATKASSHSNPFRVWARIAVLG